MQIDAFPVGNLQTNCYVVVSPEKEAIIIDPGFDYTYEAKQVEDFVEKQGLKVKFLVNTHGHYDHIGGDALLQKKYGVPLLIHENDKQYLTKQKETASLNIVTLKEGDLVKFGSVNLKVLHTPGHSKGSICLIGEGVVFSGDTLFSEGIGRTDFEGGSMAQMEQSLQKLMQLPENLVVYPGHNESTTIGKEKSSNPFF
jgi:hydroxyacylglutathione hydrolase